MVAGWLKPSASNAVASFEPTQPIPSNVPLPPRRDGAVSVAASAASGAGPLNLSALKPAKSRKVLDLLPDPAAAQ